MRHREPVNVVVWIVFLATGTGLTENLAVPIPVFLPGLVAEITPAATAIEMMTPVFECFSGHLIRRR
jgi:hypothetical protein